MAEKTKSQRSGRWGRKKPGGKPAQKRKVAPKQVTRQQYLALRKDYLELQNITHAAKVAGMSYGTARRYIYEGSPAKNMPPIINFVKRTAEKDTSKLEFTLDEFRRKYLKEVFEALSGHIIDMRLHKRRLSLQAQKIEADDQYKPKVDSRMIDSTKGLDILVRLAERMLGGADETYKVTGDNVVSRMTEEEAIEYLKTASIPDRLR